MNGNPVSYIDPFGLSKETEEQSGSDSMWDKIEKEFGISKEAAEDFALDLLGFIPGYGDYFDLLHGIKYWEEGDIFNAVCCFGSLIPLLGDGLAKGAKYTLKYLDDIGVLEKIFHSAKKAKLLGDNAYDCVKIVQDAEKILNYSDYAKQATHLGKTNKVVLGKFNQDGFSYLDIAEEFKATFFQLDDWNEIEKIVGENNMWNINEAFLEQQLKEGREFILSHDPYKATGYFAQEVDFLKKKGFTFEIRFEVGAKSGKKIKHWMAVR